MIFSGLDEAAAPWLFVCGVGLMSFSSFAHINELSSQTRHKNRKVPTDMLYKAVFHALQYGGLSMYFMAFYYNLLLIRASVLYCMLNSPVM